MDMKTVLAFLISHRNLSESEMASVMHIIMTNNATPAQIGGFLIGLQMKGETVEEIATAAKVIRQAAISVDIKDPHLVDIVGTGGDRSHTFNISTTSAFVAAAAGAKVAKHNNRAISSFSGSADVLEIAGINVSLTPAQIAQCIKEVGVCFMFAPRHHASWAHTIEMRRELGVRTIFNLLGPLTNPAQPPNQLVGVFSKEWVQPMAEAFKELGSDHTLVVHSEDGLDEISITTPTFVAELKYGNITTYTINPTQFGLTSGDIDQIRVMNPEQSFHMMQQVLDNQPGPARDIVALNAGAAIYAAGLANSLKEGVAKALTVIANGAAKNKLQALKTFTNHCQ